MKHAIVRLRGVRMAVVLVERFQLADEYALPIIRQVQGQLGIGAMLVAQDAGTLNGLRARAEFDAQPYLFALLAGENIEWSDLPEPIEPDPPF